jgi:GT2 family glycosyltransferase
LRASTIRSTDGWTAALIAGVPGELTFAREELRGFLEEHAAEEDFVLFVPSGTILVENALARFSSAIAAHPDALAIYGDVDVLDGSGRPWPLLFPAFDYERLLEQGYCAFLFAARKEVVRRAIENSADDFMQVFFALLREGPIDPARVVHLPGAVGILPPFDREKLAERLARAVRDHLAARGTSASVETTAASLLPAVHVRREVPFSNSVSIVIPTRNRVDLLRPCLEAIGRAETTHVAEVIVVDNDSSDPETLDFLEDEQRSGRSRVLRVPGHFNYSRLNNIAVNSARGRNICLLNNDVEVISPDWLEEMLGRLEDPDVGAVGALLIWPSGVVQHGGVVLGTHFAADHAFSDRLADDPGYCDLLRVAHQCSAVTAACLLTRKEDYFAVGGLDESFLPVNFNDVDFCLRLRARHKRVVFTPHAKLLHHESVSRGPDKRTNRENRARRELATLRARWLDVLISDPFYSPALALDHFPYAGLAWPPRPMEPRLATSPVPVETLPGF